MKTLISSLIILGLLGLTACGGGSATPVADVVTMEDVESVLAELHGKRILNTDLLNQLESN